MCNRFKSYSLTRINEALTSRKITTIWSCHCHDDPRVVIQIAPNVGIATARQSFLGERGRRLRSLLSGAEELQLTGKSKRRISETFPDSRMCEIGGVVIYLSLILNGTFYECVDRYRIQVYVGSAPQRCPL
ncbi:hypothetical protein AVEN_84438-1 [Araneus ventricosus]|uniref:Uncharacterized protein n=1 Tax=Araneus ventricosus TaxID=182803 RepID=A0A4Y2R1U4_ARAVE|nr:hypothetical protein AVEN_84438-1 [Araneus ventricosus]